MTPGQPPTSDALLFRVLDDEPAPCLQATHYTDGDEHLIPGPTMRDVSLRTSCLPTEQANGAIRCIPTSTAGSMTDPADTAGRSGKTTKRWLRTMNTNSNECSPITLADGTIRCLPSPSNLNSLFTDAACQTPITLKYQFAQCSDLQIYPLIHLASNDCPITRQIFKVGDRYTGELYRYIAGVCARVDQSDPGTYYSVGSDVPVTSFAQGTLVTEP